jgi:hypothetical protein
MNFLSFLLFCSAESSFLLEKRKEEQKKTGERFQRSELLGNSVSCTQPPKL